MKSTALKICAIMLLLPAMSHAKKVHNYKYVYKEGCNCFISKDNPAGIEQVTISSYNNDPDVHVNIGFYHVNSSAKVDSFSLADFSPKHFGCQPCATIQPGINYVIYFMGKPGMDQVEFRIHKDEKGKITVEK